jgi:translation initiation factor IF-2
MLDENNQKLESRPPVVVVLGHVDHGKSSILSTIKDFKITENESGGITQHIGAYQIEHQNKKITFIDTPGHEAFSAMRLRGAQVADIAILVVAAEDGIKNQTKEAISHIKKAQIPMIVAINKIDKIEANAEKVKTELSAHDVVVESMGGKVPCVETSALTGKGISDLLDLILLVAEIEELKQDRSQPAQGVVIESYLDSSRGPTATLILRNGILKKGDIFGTQSCCGKVKVIENFQGISINTASSSTPAVVLGFEGIPGVGEKFMVFPNMVIAQSNLEEKTKSTPRVFNIEPDKKVLNLILKADVLGSLEAIREVLKDLPQDKVILRILLGEVGDIGESDVKIAVGAKAIIIGFRVKTNPSVEKLARRDEVKIKVFDIIYELAQAVRQALEKRLGSETIKESKGKIRILEIFRTEKNSQIIGGKIFEGEIKKGSSVEIYRNEERLGKGKITGLQKDKKSVEKLGKGAECGMLYSGNIQIQVDDVLEAYVEEKRRVEL